jgi:hypothetical protein
VGTSPDSPLTGLHRVLEIRKRINSATLIPIPIQPRQSPEAQQKNYYAKGFIVARLTELEHWLETRQIQRTEVNVPAHWLMSDAQLRTMLSRGRNKDETPPALARRDTNWKLIEPLVPAPAGSGKPQHNLTCLDALVKGRAKDAKVSAGKVFDALHRFYAYGCIVNALLPQTIGRCGKHGLDFPAEDFPSLLFAKYQSDNGELRCKDGITVITESMKSKVEFIPSQRADLNSPSETGHQIRHKTLDCQLPGATFGRQTKRGEAAPVLNSMMSKYAYMQTLIDWIHWFNVEKKIDLRDIPAEMQRDFAREGKALTRTRLELFRWARLNGYVTGQPINLDYRGRIPRCAFGRKIRTSERTTQPRDSNLRIRLR